jgi:hypothetical protein
MTPDILSRQAEAYSKDASLLERVQTPFSIPKKPENTGSPGYKDELDAYYAGVAKVAKLHAMIPQIAATAAGVAGTVIPQQAQAALAHHQATRAKAKKINELQVTKLEEMQKVLAKYSGTRVSSVLSYASAQVRAGNVIDPEQIKQIYADSVEAVGALSDKLRTEDMNMALQMVNEINMLRVKGIDE